MMIRAHLRLFRDAAGRAPRSHRPSREAWRRARPSSETPQHVHVAIPLFVGGPPPTLSRLNRRGVVPFPNRRCRGIEQRVASYAVRGLASTPAEHDDNDEHDDDDSSSQRTNTKRKKKARRRTKGKDDDTSARIMEEDEETERSSAIAAAPPAVPFRVQRKVRACVRKMRSVVRSGTKTQKTPVVPLQTRENAELLYDSIALHLDGRALDKLVDHLCLCAEKDDDEDNDGDDAGEQRWARRSSHPVLDDDPWIAPLLSEFLRSTSSFATTRVGTSGAPASRRDDHRDRSRRDPSFPPNEIRRRDGGRAAAVLARARDEVARRPVAMRWAGGRSTKTNDDARAQHDAKSDDVKRREAERLSHLLANRLPPSHHESLVDLLARHGDPHQKKGATIKSLFPKVRSKVRTHAALVVRELAEFFYVDVPVDDEENENTNDDDQPNIHNAELRKAWRQWNKKREKHVASLLLVQHYLALYDEEERTKRIAKQTKTQKLRDEAEKTVENLHHATKPKPNTVTSKKRRARLDFDAVKLTNDHDNDDDELEHRTRNVVFLTNLPVDVTEQEVTDLCSRCGPVAEVDVRNRRPDLDRGPPSRTPNQQEHRRRERRTIAADGRRATAPPPRSPVYAVVRFADEKGRDAAVGPDLSVLGAVLRRRVVRSVPSSAATELFLENVPPDLHRDLERRLDEALRPRVHVCLGRVDGRPSADSVVDCALHFPDFETAAFAHRRISSRLVDVLADARTDDNDDDYPPRCELHWMRTPDDAVKYWTREIDNDEA